jgi:hypothetical protein
MEGCALLPHDWIRAKEKHKGGPERTESGSMTSQRASKVPLAFKPKPVELARFLIAGTTGQEDYTGSLTVSPSSWPAHAQLNSLPVSPVTTPDAGSAARATDKSSDCTLSHNNHTLIPRAKNF